MPHKVDIAIDWRNVLFEGMPEEDVPASGPDSERQIRSPLPSSAIGKRFEGTRSLYIS